MTTRNAVHLRWTIRKDMRCIGLIDEASFECPWPTDVYADLLRERNTVSMTAEVNDRIVGYMVYQLCRGYFRILRMAVHPSYRGTGIGESMIDFLKAKMGNRNRVAIIADVPESNLYAQLFLKSCGFACESIIRGGDEDAYEMVYHGS
jgi:[ribosomal protein S18]-alanine N-acetyltransferase